MARHSFRRRLGQNQFVFDIRRFPFGFVQILFGAFRNTLDFLVLVIDIRLLFVLLVKQFGYFGRIDRAHLAEHEKPIQERNGLLVVRHFRSGSVFIDLIGPIRCASEFVLHIRKHRFERPHAIRQPHFLRFVSRNRDKPVIVHDTNQIIEIDQIFADGLVDGLLIDIDRIPQRQFVFREPRFVIHLGYFEHLVGAVVDSERLPV